MAQAVVFVNNARFLIQACKGIIRSHQVRRALMFWNVVVLLVLIVLGSTFLWPWLRAHPVFFLGYWGVCGWLTLLSILLAVYDMARLRLDAKETENELKRQFLRGEDSDSSHDSHSH